MTETPPAISGLKALTRPAILQHLSERTKCLFCRVKFTEPVLLPVPQELRRPGAFQPTFNAAVLHHVSDTHGYPKELFKEWLIDSVYGKGTVWNLDIDVDDMIERMPSSGDGILRRSR